MVSLVKMGMTAVALVAMALCVFIVDWHGKSLAGHVADIWRSPVMQEKVQLAEESMGSFSERWQTAKNASKELVADELQKHEIDQLTDEDRAKLNELVAKIQEKSAK